jgi:flagellar biosynthesis/type III secretory pathway protein FliH
MEKYVEDYLFLSTGIEMAIKEAREEALVEGKQEGLIIGQSEALHKIKLVIEQLNKGIPVETIAADLNIDISMVEEIKRMTNS